MLFSSVGLCTAGSTGELNSTYNGVFSVDEFKTVEAEFANLKSLAKTEVINVDYETFGNVGVDGTHFEFLH